MDHSRTKRQKDERRRGVLRELVQLRQELQEARFRRAMQNSSTATRVLFTGLTQGPGELSQIFASAQRDQTFRREQARREGVDRMWEGRQIAEYEKVCHLACIGMKNPDSVIGPAYPKREHEREGYRRWSCG